MDERHFNSEDPTSNCYPAIEAFYFFYQKRALNRQTERSGLLNSAACLPGRHLIYNKLQYAYVSHKIINLNRIILFVQVS